jgi:hypothetical protein
MKLTRPPCLLIQEDAHEIDAPSLFRVCYVWRITNKIYRGRGGGGGVYMEVTAPSVNLISGVLPDKARLDTAGVIKVNYT